jgi:hypothetical protein
MFLIRELDAFPIGRRCFRHQIRFDGIILFKERAEIHDQVLHDLKHRKGLDEDLLFEISDQLLTREAADAVDPHPV